MTDYLPAFLSFIIMATKRLGGEGKKSNIFLLIFIVALSDSLAFEYLKLVKEGSHSLETPIVAYTRAPLHSLIADS